MGSTKRRLLGLGRRGAPHWAAVSVALLLTGCSARPLIEYSRSTPPLVLVPAQQAGVDDQRGRFRELFCAVNLAHGAELPDHRPCDDALARLDDEPPAPGMSAELGPAARPLRMLVVPGLGWDCFEALIDPRDSIAEHVAGFGYRMQIAAVESLSGSVRNAELIRDQVLALPPDPTPLVLLGYSKGTVDILEALVRYPELGERVSAVVSVAGAVGGSALANTVSDRTLGLLKWVPGADCEAGDGDAMASMRPVERKHWLARHRLPADIRYYSLVSYPDPQRVSTGLLLTYRKLSQIDARNDGQLLFYDQLIPGSTLLAYLNGDHWAVATPIARRSPVLAATFADHNAYPREVLLETLFRYLEQDLGND